MLALIFFIEYFCLISIKPRRLLVNICFNPGYAVCLLGVEPGMARLGTQGDMRQSILQPFWFSRLIHDYQVQSNIQFYTSYRAEFCIYIDIHQYDFSGY